MVPISGYFLPTPPKYVSTFVTFWVPTPPVTVAIICECLLIDLDFVVPDGSKMSRWHYRQLGLAKCYGSCQILSEPYCLKTA